MTNSIYQFLIKYQGNWDCIYDAINKKEHILKSSDFKINEPNIFITNDNYPQKLKEILLPPFFVFYKGDINYLDDNVLTIIGQPSINDLNLLINNKTKKTICMNCKDLTPSIYQSIIASQRRLIVVCEGGIDAFKYKWEKNVLLISEYNNSQNYSHSKEQTIERLLFAFGDTIYLDTNEESVFKNLIVNLDQVKKPIYVKLCHNKHFKTYNLKYNNIIYTENIIDATNI